jgi:hypothetical protein
MKVVDLPPITAAEREQDDLFVTRTLVCGGCGAEFTTTNPRAAARCAECNAGLKVKVVCPACGVETIIGLLAATKLCAPCQVDLEWTTTALRVRLDHAQAAADAAWTRLDADLAHADPIDRARYDAALERAAEWSAERWSKARDAAIAKGDGLSPLLAARLAWDDAAAALDREKAAVALGLDEVERARR